MLFQNPTAQISARNICTGASVPTRPNTKEMHFLSSPLRSVANLSNPHHHTEQQEFLRKASVLNPTESCHLAARTQPVVCRRGVLSSNSCAVCERQRLTSTSQHGTDAWHFRGAKEVIAFRWGGWAQQINKSDTPLLELILSIFFFFFT